MENQHKITIIMSTDGKHTVMVNADELVDSEVKRAYALASKIYNQILKDHGEGTKVSVMREASKNGKVPSCPVHNVPMDLVPAGVSKRTSKPYDAFYACNIPNCTETQKK